MARDASNAGHIPDDLDRYRDGDQAAFLRLWDNHRDDFVGWLRRHLGGDEFAAEDLLNDTAAKLVTPAIRATYDRRKPWGGWAFTILRNLTVDFLRRRIWRIKREAVALNPLFLPDPDSSVDDDGLAEDLHTCLGALPARLREMMVQRFLEDKQQTEIARDMSLSTATVSKNLEKARNLLAECLEEKGHGDRLR
jgi:RNA polymerase sigma-70 factor (ECF subfamily)